MVFLPKVPLADYTFYLYVSDGKNYSSQTIRLTVDYQNSIPVFETQADVNAKVNENYTYYFKAFDEDLCDNIEFKIYNKPAWLTFTDNGDRTGLLSGVPPKSSFGDYTFYLYGTDGKNYSSQTIRLTVDNPNSIPVFKTEAAKRVYTNEMYTYYFKAFDKDLSDNLTFKIYNKPSWLTFSDNGDGTGLLSGVPTMSEYTDYTFYLYVSDGQNYSYETIRLEVLPNPLMPEGTPDSQVNYKPVFANQYLPQAKIDQPYKAVVFAYDLENNATSILNSANNLPGGLQLKLTNNQSGLLVAVIEGTPSAIGTHTFSLDVSDGLNTINKQYSITIVDTNQAPEFLSKGNSILNLGDEYVYNIMVNDIDEDNLTVSYVGDLPEGLSFSQATNITATLSGNIANSGHYNIKLSVSGWAKYYLSECVSRCSRRWISRRFYQLYTC